MAFATRCRWFRACQWLLVTVLVFPPMTHSDTGSKLEKFEKDATRPRVTADPPEPAPPLPEQPPATPTAEPDGHDVPSSDTVELVAIMLLLIPAAMVAGGVNSWERVTPTDGPRDTPDKSEVSPRLFGEGVVPFARLDASYHRIGSRIHAADSRVEIGYGPFGFEYRTLRYNETGPDADLEVKQHHVLYRMSAGDHVEIDIGFGRLDLAGVGDNSGSSFTLPILIHPSPRFGIEYRPSWASINGSSIGNHELAISSGGRFWAIRGGYHWLESPDERLSGPFVGLSLRL